MDINLFVQRLKHGDSYTVQDGDNDPYLVHRPPNSLMIKAADIINQLSGHLNQSNEIINNLQRQLNEAHETLRNSSTTTTPGGTTG